MTRLFINGHRCPGRIDGTVAGKSGTNNLSGLFVGDEIVETQADPLKFCRVRMNPDGVIITQRCVVFKADLDNRIYIAELANICG